MYGNAVSYGDNLFSCICELCSIIWCIVCVLGKAETRAISI
jgi:hypothetical protein